VLLWRLTVALMNNYYVFASLSLTLSLSLPFFLDLALDLRAISSSSSSLLWCSSQTFRCSALSPRSLAAAAAVTEAELERRRRGDKRHEESNLHPCIFHIHRIEAAAY
jgi:hypothetical protein